jgi:hypothetical protein
MKTTGNPARTAAHSSRILPGADLKSLALLAAAGVAMVMLVQAAPAPESPNPMPLAF